MRTALFWDIMQRIVVFRTDVSGQPIWSHIQGSISPSFWTSRLSRNVDKQLPPCSAEHPRTAQILSQSSHSVTVLILLTLCLASCQFFYSLIIYAFSFVCYYWQCFVFRSCAVSVTVFRVVAPARCNYTIIIIIQSI